jgi:hypothetical protein
MTKESVFQIAENLGCEIPSGPEGREFYFSPSELMAFVEQIVALSKKDP